MDYPRATSGTPAFDFGGWHPSCAVYIVPKGDWLYLVCDSCRCACELEAAAPHVDVKSTSVARAQLPTQPVLALNREVSA